MKFIGLLDVESVKSMALYCMENVKITGQYGTESVKNMGFYDAEKCENKEVFSTEDNMKIIIFAVLICDGGRRQRHDEHIKLS